MPAPPGRQQGGADEIHMSGQADLSDNDDVLRTRMTLGEHLDELRVRLIRSAVCLALVFAAGWMMHERIADAVLAPAEVKAIPWLNQLLLERTTRELVDGGVPGREELELQFRDGPWLDAFESRLLTSTLARGEELENEALVNLVGEPLPAIRNLVHPIPNKLRADASAAGMVFYLKVCFYFAIFLGGPFCLWQVWAFVAAGLYHKEKRVVYVYAPFSMLLFIAGVVFGYYYMVPYAQYFLAEMGLEQFYFDLRLELYLDFFTKLSLGLGIVFQLPILMIVLARTGLVDPRSFGKFRGHFLLGALIFAAILTPPDPYTQLMMAGPMVVLYELGILLARIMVRRSHPESVARAGA